MNWKAIFAAGAILLHTGTLLVQTPDGMVAYWDFNQGTGNIAHDSINDNHGDTLGATQTNGRVGGALYFDGLNDYVIGAYASGLSYRFGTIEGWIKLHSYPTGYRYGVIANAVSGQSSCEQIIEAQGLGKGHMKFGCSISAMDDWFEIVNP